MQLCHQHPWPHARRTAPLTSVAQWLSGLFGNADLTPSDLVAALVLCAAAQVRAVCLHSALEWDAGMLRVACFSPLLCAMELQMAEWCSHQPQTCMHYCFCLRLLLSKQTPFGLASLGIWLASMVLKTQCKARAYGLKRRGSCAAAQHQRRRMHIKHALAPVEDALSSIQPSEGYDGGEAGERPLPPTTDAFVLPSCSLQIPCQR